MSHLLLVAHDVSTAPQMLKTSLWRLWRRQMELRAGEQLLTHVVWRPQPALARRASR